MGASNPLGQRASDPAKNQVGMNPGDMAFDFSVLFVLPCNFLISTVLTGEESNLLN